MYGPEHSSSEICSGNTDELQFIFTFGQNTTLHKKIKAKKKKKKKKKEKEKKRKTKNVCLQLPDFSCRPTLNFFSRESAKNYRLPL